jgi:AcrR family transcriptional regulator
MNDRDDKLIFFDARPSRADAVKNRERLLNTAASLFAEHGVEAISMTQLAEAAGVGKGTLYRHFNNKTEVCYALLDQDQRELQTRALQRLRAHSDPLDNLRWFLEEVASFVFHNEDLLFVGVGSSANSALPFRAHLWWRQTIRGLLDQHGVPGDRDYFSDVLYVMLDVNTIHFQKGTLGYDLARIIGGLLATLDRLLS